MENDEKSGEVRKIQVTGRGSYIISLPKRWVKEKNLNRGEQIVFSTDEDGSLRIMARTGIKKPKPLETTITVFSQKNDLESITRRIVSLYLIGFNVIRVRTTEARFGSSQSDYIREFVRKKLVGTEVVTESPNEIVLQILISYPELSVENALRRMVIIALAMVRDAMTALAQKDDALAGEVLKMDDEVDRFGFYIVRQLKTAVQDRSVIHRIGLGSGRDIIGYRLVAKSVERAADHAAKIAENVIAMKQSVSPKLLEKINRISELATKVLEDAMTALYTRNYEAAEGVFKRMSRIESLEREAIVDINRQRIDPVQMASLRLILESLRRVGEYGSDIAEVVLNLTAVEIA